MKLTYHFKADDTIQKRMTRIAEEVTASFDLKWIRITIEKKRKQRSSHQNRYIWGVLYPAAAAGFREAGNFGVSVEMVHEFFKNRFLDNGDEIISPLTGEVIKMGSSTRLLSTGEAMEYIMEIQQFLAEFFNITVPDPGEQAEMFL